MAYTNTPNSAENSASGTKAEKLERQLDTALEDAFSTSDPVSLTMPDSRDAERVVREKSNSRPLGMILPMLITVAIGLVAVNALRRYLED
jgi:hypothetical protein